MPRGGRDPAPRAWSPMTAESPSRRLACRCVHWYRPTPPPFRPPPASSRRGTFPHELPCLQYRVQRVVRLHFGFSHSSILPPNVRSRVNHGRGMCVLKYRMHSQSRMPNKRRLEPGVDRPSAGSAHFGDFAESTLRRRPQVCRECRSRPGKYHSWCMGCRRCRATRSLRLGCCMRQSPDCKSRRSGTGRSPCTTRGSRRCRPACHARVGLRARVPVVARRPVRGDRGSSTRPLPGLHVPAAWHWSLAVHVTGLPPVQAPPGTCRSACTRSRRCTPSRSSASGSSTAPSTDCTSRPRGTGRSPCTSPGSTRRRRRPGTCRSACTRSRRCTPCRSLRRDSSTRRSSGCTSRPCGTESLAVHVTGLRPVQVPLWQVSVWVHAFPSLQAVPFVATGSSTRPCRLQVPAVWHWSLAVHVTGFAAGAGPALARVGLRARVPVVAGVPSAFVGLHTCSSSGCTSPRCGTDHSPCTQAPCLRRPRRCIHLLACTHSRRCRLSRPLSWDCYTCQSLGCTSPRCGTGHAPCTTLGCRRRKPRPRTCRFACTHSHRCNCPVRLRGIAARAGCRVARPRTMALVARSAHHRITPGTRSRLAGIRPRTRIPIVAGCPVLLRRVRAKTCARGARADIAARVTRRAGHRAAPNANFGLVACICLRTQVPIVAGRCQFTAAVSVALSRVAAGSSRLRASGGVGSRVAPDADTGTCPHLTSDGQL